MHAHPPDRSTLSPARLALALALAACGGDAAPADAPAATTDGRLADAALVDAPAAVDAAPSDAPAAVTVNGCTQATAMDFTSAALTITFPGLSYSPRCARIRAGQSATFMGNFGAHPLRAGAVAGATVTPTPGSPIPSVSSGSTPRTVMFPTTGTFPYYCDFHRPGMAGVIYVEP